MAKPLRIAAVGLGRIGRIHAQHVREVASEHGRCELTALVDVDAERTALLANNEWTNLRERRRWLDRDEHKSRQYLRNDR